MCIHRHRILCRVAERIDRADAKTVVKLREYTSVILIILLKKSE